MKTSIKEQNNNLYSESRVSAFLRANFPEVMRWRLQGLFNGVREEAYKKGYEAAVKAFSNNQKPVQYEQR